MNLVALTIQAGDPGWGSRLGISGEIDEDRIRVRFACLHPLPAPHLLAFQSSRFADEVGGVTAHLFVT